MERLLTKEQTARAVLGAKLQSSEEVLQDVIRYFGAILNRVQL